MSILTSLTVKPLLWACGILLAACSALAISMVVINAKHDAAMTTANSRADAAEILAGNRQLAITSMAHTNLTQNLAIDDLAKRLDEAVGKKQQTEQALASAEKQRDAARQARDTLLAQSRAETEKTYATDPTCAAWGRAPVCPGISDSVQKSWRAAGQPGGDRDPDR